MTTVADVIDAIEKNGYEQIKGYYVRREPRKIGPIKFGKRVVGACAIGQGALNLGIDPGNLGGALSGVRANYVSMYVDIIRMNDKLNLPLERIAAELRARYKDQLNDELDI